LQIIFEAMSEIFSRSAALLGDDAMRKLAAARILVVGVGGVGGWCAEALARTGVGHIVLMDDDMVAASNINRQCPATASTIGMPKAEVMAARLKAINPGLDVKALPRRYEGGEFAPCDIVIDAIDSVDCKAALILEAADRGVPLISSMGAAFRLDPTKVRITRFEKVEGDGLAKALRNRFRRIDRRPGKFECVWSTELPVRTDSSSQAKGSLMQVTATFGMCLAAKAVEILVGQE
jgi:tRNA A37 threonylcarbamoyladenosine dehydratase